jgi:hypothetical protein
LVFVTLLGNLMSVGMICITEKLVSKCTDYGNCNQKYIK